MSFSNRSKFIAVGLAAIALVGTAGEAFAKDKYHEVPRHRHYYRGGYGPGPAIAGAALGIMGAAAAGIAADRYYNGYPAYSYGPRYGGYYGYDYHPNYGYYGPY